MNPGATSLESLNKVPLNQCVTEPPVTRSFSGLELLALQFYPLLLSLPGNTVHVEHGVKEVTAAALLCADSREQDGVIFQKKAARKKNPLAMRNRVWSS